MEEIKTRQIMVPNIYRTFKVSFNSLRLNNYPCLFSSIHHFFI